MKITDSNPPHDPVLLRGECLGPRSRSPLSQAWAMTFLLAALLFAALTSGACRETTAPPATGGWLRTVVSGESWQSSDAHATLAHGVLYITASRSWPTVRERLDLVVHDVAAPGVFLIGMIGIAGTTSVNSGAIDRDGHYFATAIRVRPYASADAVVISRLTADSVVGQFHFVARRNADEHAADTLNITDGSFAIALSKQP